MKRYSALLFMALCFTCASLRAVGAEVSEVKIAGGFGLTNLPLMVMQKQNLIEKHARAAGIELKGNFVTVAGGANMNDAMLAGAIDVGFPSPTSFLPLWARTRGTANEVKAVGAITSMPLVLTTRNPNVKTVRDFTEKDKIAVPSLRVSIQPILLRMAVAKEFGEANSGRLDPMTIALSHPEATQAMLAGAGEVTAHFTSPPYYQMQLKKAGIRTILNSYDLMNGPSTFVIGMAPSKFVNGSPKAYAAFVAALEESIAFINRNKPEAAQIYLEMSKDKTPFEEILAMLNDPQIVFTPVPQKTMVYADFMFRDGMIKVKPETWRDLFYPNAHKYAGS
jgi:NitT/TauT family transport system substrate-binding protein